MNGRVYQPDGNSISYSDLAAARCEASIPLRVELRPKSEWKYVGKTMPRVDMLAKATGTAEFGIDVRLEGMKYATVRMNPRLGAPMKSMDATAAALAWQAWSKSSSLRADLL